MGFFKSKEAAVNLCPSGSFGALRFLPNHIAQREGKSLLTLSSLNPLELPRILK